MVPIVKVKTYPVSHKAEVSSSTLFRVKGVFITLRSTTDGEGGKACNYLKSNGCPSFSSVARNSHLTNRPEADDTLTSPLSVHQCFLKLHGKETIEWKDLRLNLGIKFGTSRPEGSALTFANPSFELSRRLLFRNFFTL